MPYVFNPFTGTFDITTSATGGTPAGSTGQIQFNNAGAFGASSNLFWDSANTRLGVGTASPAARGHFIPESASVSGLVVQGAASQWANLQEWRNSSNTALSSILATGEFRGRLSTVLGSNVIGHVIQATAGQTAALTEWRNSSGTVLSNVASNGTVNAGGLNCNGNFSMNTNNYIINLTNTVWDNYWAPGLRWGSGVGMMWCATASPSYNTAPECGIFRVGTNIVGIRTMTGAGPFTVSGYGDFVAQRFSAGTTTISAMYNAVIDSATRVGVQVKAAASQTADLLQLQDSTGAVLTEFTANGAWQPASMADSAAANGTVYFSTTASKLVYKDAGGVVNNLY